VRIIPVKSNREPVSRLPNNGSGDSPRPPFLTEFDLTTPALWRRSWIQNSVHLRQPYVAPSAVHQSVNLVGTVIAFFVKHSRLVVWSFPAIGSMADCRVPPFVLGCVWVKSQAGDHFDAPESIRFICSLSSR